MKIDPRAIEPFNAWWRTRNHCEPNVEAIDAFAAGFKAGMQRAVDEAVAIIKKPIPAVGKEPVR